MEGARAHARDRVRSAPVVTAGRALSWLFVPGHRPDRFDKAVASGAHEVIVDLEDAVAPAAKISARSEVVRWLGAGGSAWVRINGVETAWYDDDVAALAGVPALRGVMVPKAERTTLLLHLRQKLPPAVGVLALIESAVGVHQAALIADTPGISGLAFGSVDFALDIDAEETDDALLYAHASRPRSSSTAEPACWSSSSCPRGSRTGRPPSTKPSL